MTRLNRDMIVPQSFVGLLYEDGVFVRELAPGRVKLTQGFFRRQRRHVTLVDLRERSLVIKGQEILTADKVAIRISLLVYFRVRDAMAAVHEVVDYEDRIYEDVQLAARRFLSSRKLDAILNDRNEISAAVLAVVKDSAAGYGVEVLRADVKDLAFPGNLREIMNQVLETERRAEARLIQARKDAEALRIKTASEAETAEQQITTERARLLSLAQAEQDAARLRLAAEQEEARAIAEDPRVLTLRELTTLAEMAKAGAKFAVGLRAERLLSLAREPE